MHHDWHSALRAQLPPNTPTPILTGTRHLRVLNTRGYPQPAVEFAYGEVRVVYDGANWYTPGILTEVAP